MCVRGPFLAAAACTPPSNTRPRRSARHAEALGGNSLTLLVATLRQGDWEASLATLRHAAAARGVRNFPIINHGRARGLMHKLRVRLLSVMVHFARAYVLGHCPCPASTGLRRGRVWGSSSAGHMPTAAPRRRCCPSLPAP